MHSNCKLEVSQQKRNLILSSLIICFILTPFLSLPSQPLLPSPLKLHNFTTPTESLMRACCVCRFGISFTYVIKSIDSKLISVCLINDYLPTYIYLFMDAQNAHPFHSNV